jgi:serine/threonine-protein kinase
VDRIGRYQIKRELGHGAMGVVYEAVDPTIGRTVAIKTIRLREVDDPAQRDRLKERLFREARAAGVLSHPNIVTIYAMEEDDGLAYIAMQFVNGPTLDEVMSRPKPMSAQEMFRILRETASGLDFAHGKGIVHRDIKPANIMIDEHGTAKIADFGIAKAGASGDLTISGTILGTPNYMSPEQVQGKDVDGRADQFSLAVVAYEILTGERPFAGEHLGTVVYRIVAEEPAVVHRLNPSLSPEIDTVLRKALSKKPDLRYANCTAFVNALEGACLQADGWQSLARGTSHTLPTGGIEPTAKTRPPKPARSGRRSSGNRGKAQPDKPSIFLPAMAAFLVVLGVLALLGWQSGLWQPGGAQEALKPAQPSTEAAQPQPQPGEAPRGEETKPQAETSDVETKPDVEAPPKPRPVAPKRDTVPAPVVARKASKQAQETKVAAHAAAPQPAVVAPPAPRLADPQDIFIQTNPSGVKATLDNRPDMACETPCVLLASQGAHILSLTLANYQKEIQPIRVGDSRLDVPLITMHPNGGTLLISTVPQGANIFIDNRLMGSMTPAQLSLPAGSYQIKVELNGMRKTETVQVSNGNTKYLKITLEP